MEAAPVGGIGEILSSTSETNQQKIQIAKEIVHYAFLNNQNQPYTVLAKCIAERIHKIFNEKWNCTVWEWNKGGISFYCKKRIDIKYNNNKIILWKND